MDFSHSASTLTSLVSAVQLVSDSMENQWYICFFKYNQCLLLSKVANVRHSAIVVVQTYCTHKPKSKSTNAETFHQWLK